MLSALLNDRTNSLRKGAGNEPFKNEFNSKALTYHSQPLKLFTIIKMSLIICGQTHFPKMATKLGIV